MNVEPKFVYLVRMTTQNPSADDYCYFSTLKKANAFVKEKTESVKKQEQYYGEVHFEVEPLLIDIAF